MAQNCPVPVLRAAACRQSGQWSQEGLISPNVIWADGELAGGISQILDVCLESTALETSPKIPL